ncbi:MAG: hypothetical protein AB8B77_01245 [Alphaproteobacteria bacterium]
MYEMTPRMVQKLYVNLGKYHGLFDGGRCSGWELEELIVNSIKSDTTSQHHVKWREGGHDDKADITVKPNGKAYDIQIKSGKVSKSGDLTLSGHRLGRFEGDLSRVTEYLNNNSANIIAVPYEQKDTDEGRQHIYQICYIDVAILTKINADHWVKKGKQYTQTNASGVVFSLRPSMSWQIWWKIPAKLIHKLEPKIIK